MSSSCRHSANEISESAVGIGKHPESTCFQQTVIMNGVSPVEYVVETKSGTIMSPYHVIPLHPFLSPSDNSVSFICTYTAGHNIRHELASDVPFTPLRVAKTGDGRAAQYTSPALWNCGVLPQTCRLPKISRTTAGAATPTINKSAVGCSELGVSPSESESGDGVPIEAIEIGGGVARRVGEVYAIKVLGSFGVMREGKSGRVEWKVVGIAAHHRMAAELLDVADISRKMPGLLEDIREWFRTGETESGGADTTTFTPTEAFRGKAFTAGLLEEAHTIWQLHHRTELPPSALLPSGAPASVAMLAQAWLPYTARHCQATARPQDHTARRMREGKGEPSLRKDDGSSPSDSARREGSVWRGKPKFRSDSMQRSQSLQPPPIQRSISLLNGSQRGAKGSSGASTPRAPIGEQALGVRQSRSGVLQSTPLSAEQGGGPAPRKGERNVGSHRRTKIVCAVEWEVPMAMPPGKEWVGGGEEIAVARVVKLSDEWSGDRWHELVAETCRTHSGSGGEVRGGRSSGEEAYAERQERVRGGSEAGLRSGAGSAQPRRQQADALHKLHSLRLETLEADNDLPVGRTDDASSRGVAVTPSGRSGGGMGKRDVPSLSPAISRHQNGVTPRALGLDDNKARESRRASRTKSGRHNSQHAMEEDLRWAEQEAAEISGTAAHRRGMSGGGDNPVAVDTRRKRNVRFDQHVEVVTFVDMKQ